MTQASWMTKLLRHRPAGYSAPVASQKAFAIAVRAGNRSLAILMLRGEKSAMTFSHVHHASVVPSSKKAYRLSAESSSGWNEDNSVVRRG